MRFIALIIFFTLCTFFGLVKIYSNKPFTLNSSELIASKKEHIPMIDFTKQNLSPLILIYTFSKPLFNDLIERKTELNPPLFSSEI